MPTFSTGKPSWAEINLKSPTIKGYQGDVASCVCEVRIKVIPSFCTPSPKYNGKINPVRWLKSEGLGICCWVIFFFKCGGRCFSSQSPLIKFQSTWISLPTLAPDCSFLGMNAKGRQQEDLKDVVPARLSSQVSTLVQSWLQWAFGKLNEKMAIFCVSLKKHKCTFLKVLPTTLPRFINC